MPDQSDELLELAKAEFGEISPAEEKFFRAVAKGEFADYKVGDEKKDDPEKGDTWRKKRTLRADRIAWLCTDYQAKHYVRHSGIQIMGARIQDLLYLDFAQLDFPLTFFDCRFMGEIYFRHSMMRGLFFDGSFVKGLAADSARFDGSVHLRNGFRAEGGVRLIGVTIGGDLDCTDSRFRNPKGTAINMDGLSVAGDVFLRNGFEAEGMVRILGATIGGSLNCTNGQFKNPEGTALNMGGLKVASNVNLIDGFKAEGEVRLLGATLIAQKADSLYLMARP